MSLVQALALMWAAGFMLSPAMLTMAAINGKLPHRTVNAAKRRPQAFSVMLVLVPLFWPLWVPPALMLRHLARRRAA